MKKNFLFLFLFITGFSFAKEDFSKNIQQALESQKKAYAPYSNYRVGCALQTKSGKIFTGCNVENASYGLTTCAERTAVFKAVSEGEKELESIVVVTKDGGAPCGACRQVLNEFNPKVKIICINEAKVIQSECDLNELLPSSFGPQNLNEAKKKLQLK